MSGISQYIQTFIISGCTVTGISYLGNCFNPLVAGIIAGIPIGMPSVLLINKLDKQKSFISYTSVMVFILNMVTILCWYLLTKANYSAKKSVLISMMVWFIGGLIYYFIVK